MREGAGSQHPQDKESQLVQTLTTRRGRGRGGGGGEGRKEEGGARGWGGGGGGMGWGRWGEGCISLGPINVIV